MTTYHCIFFIVMINCVYSATVQTHGDQAIVTNTKTASNEVKGRFLNALLKPLRKVWRVYVLRTVLPSVMGAKLMVLVPTLAMVITLLEGAIAVAAFFYLLFTTAVVARDTEESYTTNPSTWAIIDNVINNPEWQTLENNNPTSYHYFSTMDQKHMAMNEIPVNPNEIEWPSSTQADLLQQTTPSPTFYYSALPITYNNTFFGSANLVNPQVSYYSTYVHTNKEDLDAANNTQEME